MNKKLEKTMTDNAYKLAHDTFPMTWQSQDASYAKHISIQSFSLAVSIFEAREAKLIKALEDIEHDSHVLTNAYQLAHAALTIHQSENGDE